MVISLSNEFHGLTTKIYTFSLLCLALQYLPITAVSVSGLKLDLSNKDHLVGGLGFVTLIITIAATFVFIRDLVFFRVNNESKTDTEDNPTIVFAKNPHNRDKFIEKYYLIYSLLSIFPYITETILPISIGIIVSLLSFQSMLIFFKAFLT